MPISTHGTAAGYRNGCRCTKCKAWNAEKQRNYRAAKSPAPAKQTPAKKTAKPRVATAAKTRSKRDRILGQLEHALDTDLAEIKIDSPWSSTLKQRALALARSIDEGDPSEVSRLMPQFGLALEGLGLPTAPASTPAAPQTGEPAQEPETNDLAALAGVTRIG
jgi:hypothetical protein